MSNQLQFFENPNFGQIRIVQCENDESLFCLADICKAIDLLNPSSVKSRLDDDQVQILDLHALKLSEGINGNTKANFVTESGFYEVLFSGFIPMYCLTFDTKEEAQKFIKRVHTKPNR